MASADVSLLMRNKLLQGLTESQVKQLARLLSHEEFSEGEVIIRENQPADRVYLLAEGKARVGKHLSGSGPEEVEIAVLNEGDFFGEMSFFIEASERSASIYALTRVRTFSLHRDEFTVLLGEHPEVMKNILSNIVIELQTSHRRFIERLRKEKDQLEAMVDERTRALTKMSQRIARELAVAQNIQRNLLPEKAIKFRRVSVRTEYLPCDELSGDIMGAFPIDESQIAIYGGDVSGHGIYAAVIMSYVKKLIETSVKRILVDRHFTVKPPGAVLSAVNTSFIKEISLGDPEIYLTLFLGVLDQTSLCFSFSSAGAHVPPLVFSSGAMTDLFTGSDYPIGHVRDHQYTTSQRIFSPGDALFFVSDGVLEASQGGEIFGMERLKAETLSMLAESSEADPKRIMHAIDAFLHGQKPQDDMCFLLMQVRE
jgi:serine phosphatase RsbU (regulator of sigma subunit)